MRKSSSILRDLTQVVYLRCKEVNEKEYAIYKAHPFTNNFMNKEWKLKNLIIFQLTYPFLTLYLKILTIKAKARNSREQLLISYWTQAINQAY